MAKPKRDERVTKRRVTMTSAVVTEESDPDTGGTRTKTLLIEAVDYVRPDILDAYVADARRRWARVAVSEEPDAGPLGYDGPTFVPFGVQHVDPATGVEAWHEFPHELAGTYFPATDCKDCTHAPEHPTQRGLFARIVREG